MVNHTDTIPIKCFGYIRVSGAAQVDGDGPERQEKAIRDYANTHGLEVAEIYMDGGVSGTLEDRPALAEMMVSLEQNGHGVKTVLIERLDRLARKLAVQENIIRDLHKQGVTLISAVEGKGLMDDDPTRVLVRQMLGAIAEYEKQMLVLKLRAARKRTKAKTGKCEGQKAFIESDHGKATVQQLISLRESGLTWQEVADHLNGDGFVTKNGKPWTMVNAQQTWRNHSNSQQLLS
ncbi:recombinase family protein [Solidesulfovibrio magneticus]|uniref:Resolvase/invertase-type recombinase catalytic domain-containing protein n=1 Tax=Solidesulfovibrio magneticus (strain ATCC 700980 / DSM 13731 / RS-1) TaxID=573370 RepID=C4XM00_SOLM1|nr:recombinase family protein [Solidesulfovibrio magneticus]BAH77128.1 hypothetical protein DMR_36370 [Solidesulfovibrio magneticus RS-1]